MSDQANDAPAPDLYLEALRERTGPKRWAGFGPVLSAFRMLNQVGRLRVLSLAGVQVLVAALGAVQVLLIKQVLQNILHSQSDILSRVLPYLVLLIAINTAVGTVTVVQQQTQIVLSELVVRATWVRLLGVASSVPLLAYEQSGFYDRLQRIISNTLTKPLLIVQGAISLAAGLFGMVGLLVVIVLVSPLLIPILLLAVVPLYLIARVGGRIDFEFAVAQTPNLRRRVAFVDLLTERRSAAEVRAFRLSGLIRRRYSGLYDDYVEALRRKTRRRTQLALASGLATLVVGAAAAAALLYLVHIGSVSLAAAGATAVAVVLLTGRIEQTFAGVSRIMDSALFIAELDEFASVHPRSHPEAGIAARTDVLPIDFGSVELKGVSFAYPGSTRTAVSDVSVRIPRGQVIALVGENGSGKTTLSKVLAGLYPPSAGTIRWDGVSLDDLDRERVARSVAIVFQDFVRYEMTLAENVGVGSPDRIERAADIAAAADEAGLSAIAAGLPHGLETFMSTRFPGGADLSVGQWQRVALARALFRDAPLVIMDEPTAALDAKAEAALFEVIARLRHGRTVILVTHRFATTKSADHILVMDGGRITEMGNHDELMALDGRYAEMFTLQSAPFTQSVGRHRPRPF